LKPHERSLNANTSIEFYKNGGTPIPEGATTVPNKRLKIRSNLTSPVKPNFWDPYSLNGDTAIPKLCGKTSPYDSSEKL
jgi:hypothetical protein